jgi:hypothetical protein
MKNLLFISFLLFSACHTKKVQQSPVKTEPVFHEYYVMIDSIKTREDVKQLQDIIGTQKDVTYFFSRYFPVKYFILRSTRAISVQEMEEWMKNTSFKLHLLTEDIAEKRKIDRVYFHLR